MSHFVKHEPCPHCGSRDNLARYSDGGAFCFGCGFLQQSNISGWVSQAKQTADFVDSLVTLPSDASKEYGLDAVEWVQKYGITTSVLMNRNVFWSYSKKKLYFTFWDTSNEESPELLAFNARSFNPQDPKKYITKIKGNLEDLLPIYQVNNLTWNAPRADRLVITEDCLSAIKIANICTDAMPCLGNDLPLIKITRLSSLYKNIIVWLDGDMYKNASRMAERFQFLGCRTKLMNTTGDPKTYRYQELSMLTKM